MITGVIGTWRIEMTKADKRASKRFKNRYGHCGLGSSHVREASEAEVMHHWRKAKAKRESL